MIANRKIHVFTALIMSSFSLESVISQEGGSLVGYCAGPPCCQYQSEGCSKADEGALIARSKVVSGPNEFCVEIMNSHWSYIPMELHHTVPREEAEKYLNSMVGHNDGSGDIAPESGRFDINNDGKLENIGWLQLYSGAGQGCDVEVFVELNEDSSNIKKSHLSEILSANGCYVYNRAFNFNGKNYIENRRTTEGERLDHPLTTVLTEIFIIENNSRHSVCKYEMSKN